MILQPPRPPREYLKDEMEMHGWDKDYILLHTQLDKETIKEFLRGNLKVSDEIATELSHLCGSSPSYWINLQRMYERK